MKLLLDEDLDVKLRFRFGPAHEISTVRHMNWVGKKNGELLALIQEAGFDAFITGDQNMPYQQNWRARSFTVVVLAAHPKRYDIHLQVLPQVLALLAQSGLAGCTLSRQSYDLFKRGKSLPHVATQPLGLKSPANQQHIPLNNRSYPGHPARCGSKFLGRFQAAPFPLD